MYINIVFMPMFVHSGRQCTFNIFTIAMHIFITLFTECVRIVLYMDSPYIQEKIQHESKRYVITTWCNDGTVCIYVMCVQSQQCSFIILKKWHNKATHNIFILNIGHNQISRYFEQIPWYWYCTNINALSLISAYLLETCQSLLRQRKKENCMIFQ